MTIQEQIAQATVYAQLWAVMLPNVEPPPISQITMWVELFDQNAIERGIRRAALKSNRCEMSATDTYKYGASVMRREMEERWAD